MSDMELHEATERIKELEAQLSSFEELSRQYDCNPSGQLAIFEAIQNHMRMAQRLCNENYGWAKRVEAQLAEAQATIERKDAALLLMLDALENSREKDWILHLKEVDAAIAAGREALK